MLKTLTKLEYILHETFLGLRRGGWMNWAALCTVTMLLFLFGLSLQISWRLEAVLNQFGTGAEVSVYLDPGARGEEVLPLVAKLPQVERATIIPKEEAWAKLVTELESADIARIEGDLGENPLVDELKVIPGNRQETPALARQISQLPGVDEVDYLDEAIAQLSWLEQRFNWAAIIITGVFSFTAVAVIATTIRLIAVARKQEIEIMRLVGATATGIYLPFIFQGMIFGIVGGAIAWVLISAIEGMMSLNLVGSPDFVGLIASSLQLSPFQVAILPFILLSLGLAIGAGSSLLALRRSLA